MEKGVHCRASLVHQVKLTVLSNRYIHTENSDLRSANDNHAVERICRSYSKPNFPLADRLDFIGLL